MASPTTGRITELDGLRALAILPVIYVHCEPYPNPLLSFLYHSGWMGVDLFFVLSGFLITGRLLETVGRKDYYRSFVLRRALRIFPLYYLCLAVFTAAIKLEPAQWADMQKWGGVLWFVGYAGNLRIALTDSFPPVFSFVPLWSLQIEEQFYLLFPVLVAFLSRRRLAQVLAVAVVVALLLRVLLYLFVPGSSAARYVFTPCRMDSLALGALVALLTRSPRLQLVTLLQVRVGAAISGSVVILCALVSNGGWGHPLMSTIGFTAISVLSTLVLVMVLRWPSSMLCRWLRWTPLVYTGQIAYGLYLLHIPAAWLARTVIQKAFHLDIHGHPSLSVPVTYAAAFIAASISWYCFEAPILGLKNRLAGEPWAPRVPVTRF